MSFSFKTSVTRAVLTAGLGLGAIALSTASVASDQEGVVTNQTPNIINPPSIVLGIVRSPEEIHSVFKTQHPDIYGWVLLDSANPTESQIFYTTADGKFGFIGKMVSEIEAGQVVNLSAYHEKEFVPEPAFDQFWSEIESSSWVAEGATDEQAKSIIYGFFDANCVYCHLSWLAFKPYMDAGLQVRWIPVGLLAESSAGKAAAILESKEPAKLMAAGHMNWEDLGREEAFPVANVTPEIQDKLDRNAILMQKIGARGTPAFLYKNAEGKVRMTPGMPKLSAIPEITGMPEIEINHPKLERFR